MAENVKVTSNGARTKTVVTQAAGVVTSVSAASKIKIGKLEDNVGNLDVGDGLETGETIVYNVDTQKWEAVSLADRVATSVSEVLSDDDISVTLNGGTF